MKIYKNYLQYIITEEGKVLRNNKILNPAVTAKGYYRITFSKNGKIKTFSVHRLVAELYVDNPNNYPFVNHIDGNKLNNHYTNLEWCNNSQNLIHAYKIGLRSKISRQGENNGRCKITEETAKKIKTEANLKTNKVKDIAQKYNVSRQLVSSIKKGTRWAHI